jgi:hypothetical protein
MSERKPEKWEEVITEQELLEFLGLKKVSLGHLRREKGFPYVAVTQTSRVYLLPDVLEWLYRNRRNKAETV